MAKKSGAKRKPSKVKAKPKAKSPAKKPAKAAHPKSGPKPAPKPKPASKPKPVPKPKAAKAEAPKPAAPAAKPPARKGITIVTPKPVKKVKPPTSLADLLPSGMGRLLDPKSPRKPLIPSGPKATAMRALGQHGGDKTEAPRPDAKTPFNKKELEHYHDLLVRKRAELAGDVATMETEALRSETGSLSNMPSHLAEQGSDASEQSLSLDLAAADRKLIKEIDDALERIANGTFGVCEVTGKPIKLDRLSELPWARLSIEAARELERHSMR